MKNPKQKYRVVILMTSGDSASDFGREIRRKIIECKDIEVPAIFISNEGIKDKDASLPSRLLKLFKKRRLFTLIIMYYHLKSKLTGRKYDWVFQPDIKPLNLSQYYNGDIHYLQSLHNHKTESLIASYEPDLCFHSGHIIIKEPIMSLAKDGVMGYHHGDLTKHRGGLPCFWELYYGEKEVGVTVQILGSKLDTGEIVLQRFFDIKDEDTLQTLQQRVHCETTDMACESILLLSNPNFTSQKPKSLGKYHKLPTLIEWLRFRYRMRRRMATKKKLKRIS